MKKEIDDESQRVSGTDDEFLTLRLDKLGWSLDAQIAIQFLKKKLCWIIM